MSKLSKQYNPQDTEQRIYSQWEESGVFAPKEGTDKKPYTVMLPPPNITGSLHMGHALQNTIIDILVRFHRMLGEPTLWLPGTDHAAIATNKVLEKKLAEEGKTRQDIGREEFMKRAEEWYSKTSKVIISQMKRIGSSCDWDRERFTMDKEYVNAVNEAFIQYFEKGYIYRGHRLINWDPQLQTTVSDIEIDWQEEKIPFYTFKYGPFEISTARPETKFGDKYVVMHPDDKRYSDYQHGDTFECEWINGPIVATIIKDKAVDPKFGTGVMTITPWHDATDFDIAERHKLEKEQIIDFDGNLMPIAQEYAGMAITEARPKIVEKLKNKGLLIKVDENYVHNIALNDRGKGVIEPQVSRQWFLNMSELKKEAIEVADNDLIKFFGPRWKKHFINWMENIRDWNINRQIWLGHRLPVWWKPGTHGTKNEKGSFKVSLKKPSGDWEQDPDVLDTWFSSALWPFATLGWPDKTKDLEKFYPTSVLITARDILYLWVARMVFSGLELTKNDQRIKQEKRIPYKQVFVHPTVLTKTGQRMSKSLGTGIDPLELIEEYGADATRFGLMYQMNYDSQAIKFDEEAIKSSRNFANKIWNIARFLEMLPEKNESTLADEWIKSRQQKVAKQVTKLLDQYKIGEAARLLHEYIWNDFADWYIEILKVQGSKENALNVFKDTLVILHPFMPHLTEELWKHFNVGDQLITHPWPEILDKDDVKDDDLMKKFQDIVNTVRSAKVLLGISSSAQLSIYVEKPVLSEVLANMCRADIAEQIDSNMKMFPLGDGSSVGISSPEITSTSLQVAREKILEELEKLKENISKQQNIIKRMTGKAPQKIVVEKEKELKQAKIHQKELKKSLELLR